MAAHQAWMICAAGWTAVMAVADSPAVYPLLAARVRAAVARKTE